MNMINVDEIKNSYFKRLDLWLKERFPPINFISGILLFVFAKSIIIIIAKHHLKNSPYQSEFFYTFRWNDVYGMLISCMHLFLLRVFDEHKDFESDRIHYPQRVIQRGIFKLEEVKTLGFIAALIQVISLIILNPSPIASYGFLILWLWTFLMVKEFFVKDWLKNKLLLYGVLHLFITPILLFFLFMLNIKSYSISEFILSTNVPILALGSVLMTGWLYDLARKCKGKDEETSDQSYTLIWGHKASMFILLISAFLSIIISVTLFKSLKINNKIILMGLFLIFLLFVCSAYKFVKKPTIATRKNNEILVVLLSTYTFLFPIIKSLTTYEME